MHHLIWLRHHNHVARRATPPTMGITSRSDPGVHGSPAWRHSPRPTTAGRVERPWQVSASSAYCARARGETSGATAEAWFCQNGSGRRVATVRRPASAERCGGGAGGGGRKARENGALVKSGAVWRGNCLSRWHDSVRCTNLAADRRHCGSGRREILDMRIDNGR